MKRVTEILIIVVILCIFSLPSSAKEPGDYIQEFDEILPQEIGDTDSQEMFSYTGVDALLYEIFASVSGKSGRIVSFLLLLFGALVLMSVTSFGEGALSEAAGVGVSVLTVSATMSAALPPLLEAAEGMRGLSEFFSLFIPVASGILVSGGAVNTAAASGAGMNVTVSLISGIGTPFFLSVAAFSLAVGAVCSFGDGALLNLSGSVKSFFMWAIGLVCATLMGAMSLQSFIAITRDNTMMRAAKYAAQSMIPIVGGTVSGALSTLATGLAYAKSIVGVGALTVIMSMFLSPLIVLLLYRLVISFCSGLAGYFGVGRAVRVFSALRLSFDIYIAVYAVSLILYVFEIALFLMCEVGTV